MKKLKEFITGKPALQVKGLLYIEKVKNKNKKMQGKKPFTDKGKHLVKAVDQPIIKIIQRLETHIERSYVITIKGYRQTRSQKK